MLAFFGMLGTYILLGTMLALGFAVAKFITLPVENWARKLYFASEVPAP